MEDGVLYAFLNMFDNIIRVFLWTIWPQIWSFLQISQKPQNMEEQGLWVAITMMLFRSPLPSFNLRPASISPTSATVFRSLFMAVQHQCDSKNPNLDKDPKFLENYPVPLSPPLPAISKDIELRRAMSASSKSSLFSLSRSDVLFEDEWLIALNKPQGIYCETILASVPSLLNDSTDESAESG